MKTLTRSIILTQFKPKAWLPNQFLNNRYLILPAVGAVPAASLQLPIIYKHDQNVEDVFNFITMYTFFKLDVKTKGIMHCRVSCGKNQFPNFVTHLLSAKVQSS